MPIYTYWCYECLTEFDSRRSIEDRDKPVICPVCKVARELGRLITKPAGIIVR